MQRRGCWPTGLVFGGQVTGYRVTQSLKYDAAGRVVASLEPQIRPAIATEAFEGFDALALTANQRGAVTLFDAQGRISCTKAGVHSALSGTSCTSSFTEDAAYRLATSFQYGTTVSGGRTMATATAIPPGRGAVTPRGTQALYRADGLADSTIDHFGNGTKLTYDLFGRPTSLTRTAAGKAASAQRTIKVYDLLGRVTQEWDPNWSPGTSEIAGSRLYSYDAMGRIYRVQLPFDPLAMARAELRYEYKSLGRRTRAYANEPTLTAGNLAFTARDLAILAYDSAYGGNSIYTYVAGRLASVSSPLTAVALGYDQNGRTTRRDQWLTGLSGAFTATGSFSDDGRLLTASFSSAYSAAANWTGSYDSAGRPVKVGLTAPTTLAAALWEAPLQGTASPYDAFDRIGVVKSNNGLVTTSRTYATYSGQITAHGVATASTQVYGAGSIVYLGTKLTSLRDTGTSTSYTYGYDANGRALSATASGGTGTLAQSYTQAYSFSDPAWAAGATVGNLERVTDGASVVNYDYAQDRLVSTSNTAGATVTTNLHDNAGRLTSKRTGGVETEGFAYDLQDQLRQVRRGGVVTEKLEYDPTGAPLYRMVGNQAAFYVSPFATVTATANAGCTGYGCAQGVSGVQVSAHIILGGSRIASVRASSVLYYHRDQRGSVIATTVTGGGVGARYRYGPYGQLDKVEGETSSTGSELGFTGGLRLGWNPSTGVQTGSLLLLGARVYDAAMKRWLQADTMDVLRYTYTDGDPVNYVDPSGRMRVELIPSGLFDGGGGGGGFGFGSGFGGIDRSGPTQGVWRPCPDNKDQTCWHDDEQVVPSGNQPPPAAGDRRGDTNPGERWTDGGRGRPSAWETFTKRAGQNWRMTTSTVMSPVRLAVSYVGYGKRPGWGEVAFGVGTWEAFAAATGRFLTGAGVPTVAGALEAGIVSNAGVPPALYAVGGEAAAVLAVRASLVTGAAFLGMGVGPVIEAAGYTLYTRLFP